MKTKILIKSFIIFNLLITNLSFSMEHCHGPSLEQRQEKVDLILQECAVDLENICADSSAYVKELPKNLPSDTPKPTQELINSISKVECLSEKVNQIQENLCKENIEEHIRYKIKHDKHRQSRGFENS